MDWRGGDPPVPRRLLHVNGADRDRVTRLGWVNTRTRFQHLLRTGARQHHWQIVPEPPSEGLEQVTSAPNFPAPSLLTRSRCAPLRCAPALDVTLVVRCGYTCGHIWRICAHSCFSGAVLLSVLGRWGHVLWQVPQLFAVCPPCVRQAELAPSPCRAARSCGAARQKLPGKDNTDDESAEPGRGDEGGAERLIPSQHHPGSKLQEAAHSSASTHFQVVVFLQEPDRGPPLLEPQLRKLGQVWWHCSLSERALSRPGGYAAQRGHLSSRKGGLRSVPLLL